MQAGQEVQLVFRVTDEGTLEVLDRGATKLGQIGAQAEAAGQRGASGFSHFQASIVTLNEGLELLKKAWDGFDRLFQPLEQADRIGKFSQAVGIGVRELTGLRVSATLADTDINSLGRSIGILSRHMLEGSATFNVLGISAKTANGSLRPTIAVLDDLADVFKILPDGPTKTAIAIQLLGRSGKQWIPILDEGSEGMRRQREAGERLGVVFDKDLSDGARHLFDDLKLLKLGVEGVLLSIGGALLPNAQHVATSMLDWALANREVISADIAGWVRDAQPQIEALVDAVTALAKQLPDIATEFTSIGGSLVTIGEGAASAIPHLGGVAETLKQIAGFYNALPAPVQAAIAGAALGSFAGQPLLGAGIGFTTALSPKIDSYLEQLHIAMASDTLNPANQPGGFINDNGKLRAMTAAELALSNRASLAQSVPFVPGPGATGIYGQTLDPLRASLPGFQSPALSNSIRGSFLEQQAAELQKNKGAAEESKKALEAEKLLMEAHVSLQQKQIELAQKMGEPVAHVNDMLRAETATKIAGLEAEKSILSKEMEQTRNEEDAANLRKRIAAIDLQEGVARIELRIKERDEIKRGFDEQILVADAAKERDIGLVETAKNRLEIAKATFATEDKQLALAAEVDAANHRKQLDELGILEVKIRAIAAERQITEEQARQSPAAAKLVGEEERLNESLKRTHDAVTKVTDDFNRQHRVVVDLSTELSGGLKRAVDGMFNSGGSFDLGQLAKNTAVAMASGFIGALAEAELKKHSFDAMVTENFTVKLPNIFKQGGDFMASAWSRSLDFMGLSTAKTTDEIGATFSDTFSNVRADTSHTATILSGLWRNNSGTVIGGGNAAIQQGTAAQRAAIERLKAKYNFTDQEIANLQAGGLAGTPAGQQYAAGGAVSALGGAALVAGGVYGALNGQPGSALNAALGAAQLAPTLGIGAAGAAGYAALIVAGIQGITQSYTGLSNAYDKGNVLPGFHFISPAERQQIAHQQFAQGFISAFGVNSPGLANAIDAIEPGQLTSRLFGGGSTTGGKIAMAFSNPIDLLASLIIGNGPTLGDQYGHALNKVFEKADIPRYINFNRTVFERDLGTLAARSSDAPEVQAVLKGSAASEPLRNPLMSFGQVTGLSDTAAGTGGYFGNSFINNARALNLTLEQTQKYFDKLAASIGATLPNTLQRAEDKFISGAATQALYTTEVKDLVTLFAHDLPPGVDAAALALKHFEEENGRSILNVDKFNKDLAATVQLFANLQSTVEGQGIKTGFANYLGAISNGLSLGPQGMLDSGKFDVAQILKQIASQKDAVSALRQNLAQSIVGGVRTAISEGLFAALKDSAPFKALEKTIAQSVTDALAGKSINTAALAFRIDKFIDASLPVLDAAAQAFKRMEDKIALTPTALSDAATSIGTEIDAAKFGRMTPKQQRAFQHKQLADTKAQLLAIAAIGGDPTKIDTPNEIKLAQPLIDKEHAIGQWFIGDSASLKGSAGKNEFDLGISTLTDVQHLLKDAAAAQTLALQENTRAINRNTAAQESQGPGFHHHGGHYGSGTIADVHTRTAKKDAAAHAAAYAASEWAKVSNPNGFYDEKNNYTGIYNGFDWYHGIKVGKAGAPMPASFVPLPEPVNTFTSTAPHPDSNPGKPRHPGSNDKLGTSHHPMAIGAQHSSAAGSVDPFSISATAPLPATLATNVSASGGDSTAALAAAIDRLARVVGAPSSVSATVNVHGEGQTNERQLAEEIMRLLPLVLREPRNRHTIREIAIGG